MANDTFEAEDVAQAKLEMIEICKQKDKYANFISETSATISAEATEASKTEQDLNTNLRERKDKATGIRQQVEQKNSELEGLKKTKDDEMAAAGKEMIDLQELADKLEKAIETEQGNLDAETKEQEERDVEAKAALDETTESRVENERRVQIATVGELLLSEKKRKMQEFDGLWETRKKQIDDGENLQPSATMSFDEIQTELESFVHDNL